MLRIKRIRGLYALLLLTASLKSGAAQPNEEQPLIQAITTALRSDDRRYAAQTVSMIAFNYCRSINAIRDLEATVVLQKACAPNEKPPWTSADWNVFIDKLRVLGNSLSQVKYTPEVPQSMLIYGGGAMGGNDTPSRFEPFIIYANNPASFDIGLRYGMGRTRNSAMNFQWDPTSRRSRYIKNSGEIKRVSVTPLQEQVNRLFMIDDKMVTHNALIEALQRLCDALNQFEAAFEAKIEPPIKILQAFETMIFQPETLLIASLFDSSGSLQYTTLGGSVSQNIPIGGDSDSKIVPNLQASASLEWLRWKYQGQKSDHALWNLSTVWLDRAPRLEHDEDWICNRRCRTGIHRWQWAWGTSLSGISDVSNSETLTFFTRYRPRIDDFDSAPYDIEGYISFRRGRGPIVGMQVSSFICW